MACLNGIQTVNNALVVRNIGRRENGCNIEISYNDNGQARNVILRVGGGTQLRDRNGCRVSCSAFQAGQTVNAAFSQVETRSIPPQARAYALALTGNANNQRYGIDIDPA